MGLHDVAQARERQGERQFRHAARIRSLCALDRDLARLHDGDRQVVHPGAVARDHAKPIRRGDHGLAHRLDTGQPSVATGHRGNQVGLSWRLARRRKHELEAGVDERLQRRMSAPRQRTRGDQDAPHHARPVASAAMRLIMSNLGPEVGISTAKTSAITWVQP